MLDRHSGGEQPSLVAKGRPMQDEGSPLLESKSELPCPRCARAMVPSSGAQSGGAKCPGCGGAWILGELLERQLREQSGDPKASLERFSWEPIDSKADLPCPTCDSYRLAPVLVGGVEIDRCDLCGGVYLDAGELEALAAAHPSPVPAPAPTTNVPTATWVDCTAYVIVELLLGAIG